MLRGGAGKGVAGRCARAGPPSARRLLSSQPAAAAAVAALPSEAEVVVIGGGSIGSAVLYHLAKDHGIKAVQLESNKLTSGTTWHSAGLLWQLAGLLGAGDIDFQLSQYTKELVETTLPAETGEWVRRPPATTTRADQPRPIAPTANSSMPQH
jgi:hypothetical protein